MAFADAFSAENVQRLMSDPRLVMGLQMLQQSGYQQGNPGFGARMGQAGINGMQQIQQANHAQQLQQYRQQMIAQQQQAQAFQTQQAQAKQEAAQRQQQAFQDPNLQSQLGPLARMLATNGVDAETILRANSGDALQAHRAAQLQQQSQQFDQRQAHQGSGGGQAQGPRMPTQRQVLDQPVGEGYMQRHVLNPQTGEYEKYGEPFAQFSPGRKTKATTGADAVVDAAAPDVTEVDLGQLPGSAPLSSYAPQPQNPTPLMTAGGSNPLAAREGMRVPGQPKVATPKTKAEYDALPAGAQYVDPVSGKTATKKAG